MRRSRDSVVRNIGRRQNLDHAEQQAAIIARRHVAEASEQHHNQAFTAVPRPINGKTLLSNPSSTPAMPAIPEPMTELIHHAVRH